MEPTQWTTCTRCGVERAMILPHEDEAPICAGCWGSAADTAALTAEARAAAESAPAPEAAPSYARVGCDVAIVTTDTRVLIALEFPGFEPFYFTPRDAKRLAATLHNAALEAGP